MAMEQLNLPTQICSMYEINLQCGDQILKSMIMQQDIILDLCFITVSKRWTKFFEFAAKETGGCGKESMEDFFGMFKKNEKS